MAVGADARGAAQGRLRWELLVNLVRKDLKVKYKNSSLGFAWSLANPLLLLAVYYLVFNVILRNGIPDFTVYLMSGLLVWNAFSTALLFASGSVIGNANLVKKVRFPTAVLPLASVGYAGAHFALQMGVFAAFLAVTHRSTFGPQLLLLVPALVVLLVLTVGLCLLVSALNVRYRDVQHLLEVVLLAWFWLNPVVYGLNLVRGPAARQGLMWLYWANPMAPIVVTFQRALYRTPVVETATGRAQVLAYDGYAGYFGLLAVSLGTGLVLLGLGVWVFRRMQGDFAEEL